MHAVTSECSKRLGLPALALLMLVSAGCRRSKPAAESLPALAAKSWRVEIDVEGFQRAVVSVPIGATSVRPVLIAIHGNADRAEWQCGSWRGIVGSRAFVLCPRGAHDASDPDALDTLGTLDQTERELRAALASLKRQFGRHVAKGAVVMAGFGEGADMAAFIARQEPTFFARVVLLGRGPDAWSSSQAQIFGSTGGKRVLFVCSSARCRELAQSRVVLTRRAGADARLSEASGVGPFFDPAMVEAIRRDFSWLVEGDPSWKLPIKP